MQENFCPTTYFLVQALKWATTNPLWIIAIIPSYSAYHINTRTYAYTRWLYLHTQIWHTAGDKRIGIYVLMAGDKRKEKQSTALLNGILCEGHKTKQVWMTHRRIQKININPHIASHLLYCIYTHLRLLNFIFIVFNS